MTCPDCQSPNDDGAEACFTCGKSLLAAPTAITRGTVIADRYEVLSPLGRGGMGMVYKAHDRVLDETVAVKTLRADIAREAESTRRFRTEIKLARKIRHRNVCAIHEYGESAGVRFIAMELVDGVDLRRKVREGGALSGREAFEVAVQAASGLQAIHNAGIIHRDLKTSNIMRDVTGRVRLMDFGIAKQFGTESTLGGRVVGTPEYMSPEQARGHKVDFRSDIYALGIVIYEVFTGRVPFQGETPIATILMHLNDPPLLEGPGAQGIPPSLVPVLRRSLAKLPQDRFATARELAAALEAARAASRPASEPGIARATEPPRDAGPSPTTGVRRVLAGRRLVVVAAAALTLAVVLAIMATRRNDPPQTGASLPSAAAPPPVAPPSVTPASAPEPSSQAAPLPTLAASPPPPPVRGMPASPVVRPTPDASQVPASVGPAPPAGPSIAPSVAPTASAAALSTTLPTPTASPMPTRPPEATPRTRPGDLVVAGPGVTLPVLVSVAQPVYPALAQRLKRQAEVVVRALVDENGRVVKAVVVEGDSSKLGFDEAALDAAYKTLYKPALKDGVPVKIWIELPVKFRPERR